jgi:N-acetylmuramoyl-L-alanine amidase
MKTLTLVFVTSIMLGTSQLSDTEHPEVTISSGEFQQSATDSIELLKKQGFARQLETPSLGSNSSAQFETLLAEIKEEQPIPHVDERENSKAYDVILQPGHYGRRQGAVGTNGHLVSERALVSYVTSVAAENLRKANVSVLVVSADHYPRPGLRAKVFLAIHADGSARPCSTGPSLGYQSRSSLLAMHAVGWGLGEALGYSYTDFRHDNFTANEAKYYMFREVQADRLTGLLEVGELTCPKSEKQLINSSNLMGTNVARAVQFIVQTPEN